MDKKISVALEAYLENISELELAKGHVRTSDIAKRMNCKLPSVTNALKRLAKLGLIYYKPYQSISMTENGMATINKLQEYHQSLANFLSLILGFPEEFSQTEACKLEHLISPIIPERIGDFTKFLNKNKQLEMTITNFHQSIKKK